MNERSDYLTWALFFVAGSLAGAGSALLLVPQSGHDTRGSVARRLRHAGRSARDLAERSVRHGDELGGAAVLSGSGGEAAARPGNPGDSR